MGNDTPCTCHETAINGEISCPAHNLIAELEQDKRNMRDLVDNLIVAIGGFESDCSEDCINAGDTEWGRKLDAAIQLIRGE